MYPTCDRGDNDRRAMLVAYIVGNDMTMFNISVDEYIFPNKEVNKSSARRRLDAQLDNLDDKELSIVEATVNGLCKAKE